MDIMDTQERYHKWHNEGMDLAFTFTHECQVLLTEILEAFHEDCDPEVRCLSVVPISGNDTFESAWLDDQLRPCCTAKIEDGAAMGWRVEFLDLHLKQSLHKLLLIMRDELTPNNNISGERRTMDTKKTAGEPSSQVACSACPNCRGFFSKKYPVNQPQFKRGKWRCPFCWYPLPNNKDELPNNKDERRA
jgi:hypothetical protein